jgi:crotonobetainyl-CoA:carnitine CoA-transferase CaiB-like acyl-CoA transferase
MSGLALITGSEGTDDPVRVSPSIIDKSAAAWAALGIVSAIYERTHTGAGQHVAVSLLGAAAHIMTQDILRYMASGVEPTRLGSGGGGGGTNGAFKGSDGKWIQIAVGNDRAFRRLCQAIDLPELADDARFALSSDRVDRSGEVRDVLRRAIGQRDAAYWIARLGEYGVPSGPVNTVGEFVEDQEVASEFIFETPGAHGGSVPNIRRPIRSGGPVVGADTGIPALGRDTADILGAELGYDPDQVKQLMEDRVVL